MQSESIMAHSVYMCFGAALHCNGIAFGLWQHLLNLNWYRVWSRHNDNNICTTTTTTTTMTTRSSTKPKAKEQQQQRQQRRRQQHLALSSACSCMKLRVRSASAQQAAFAYTRESACVACARVCPFVTGLARTIVARACARSCA